MTNSEIIIHREILAARVRKGIPEERRLVGKILRQIKSAKKNPHIRSNINEPQLRAHLQAEIEKWEARQIPKIINQFLAEIKLSLQEGENITLRDYFGLRIRRSAERKARNPQTGEIITIKEQNRVSFRVSKKLKRAIN